MVRPFGKNEGNPDSKGSAEVQTIRMTKQRATTSEMKTTVCITARTD
jgi:hypothetical protein